jgi:hypothetical protein
MPQARFDKQPRELLDYDIDLSRWMPDGDHAVSAQVFIDDGLTLEATIITATQVKLWISGGTDGENYLIAVLTTTSGGRLKEVDIEIRVRERGI